jgi:hypothetical protein
MNRREFLQAIAVGGTAAAAGCYAQSDDGGQMLPGGGGLPTEAHELTRGSVVIADTLEKAQGEVPAYPAFLVIRDEQSWYVSESTDGPNTIILDDNTTVIIEDTKAAAMEQIDSYPAFVVSREQQSVWVVEE